MFLYHPFKTERNYTQKERDLLALPVRMGGLGLTNTVQTARSGYNTEGMANECLRYNSRLAEIIAAKK